MARDDTGGERLTLAIVSDDPPPPTEADCPDDASPRPHSNNGTVPLRPAPRRERVMPHDLDAERAVLSACLSADLATVDNAGTLTPADFYNVAHQHMWTAIIDLRAADTAPDAALVAGAANVDRDLAYELATAPLAYRSNVGNYAAKISACAYQRRLIRVGLDIAEAGYLTDEVDVAGMVAKVERAAPNSNDAAWIELDTFIDTDEPDHDWIVPGLLERADRTIITATPGSGKSTLLRQLGVMVASGLHPFTAEAITPARVLLIDVENSARQTRREIRPLRAAAGDRYEPGMLEIRTYGQAINLADPATLAEILRHVEAFEPGIICTGPLYKLIGGDPVTEKDARPVADAFDRIRHVCGSALLIEAHSPYPVAKSKPIIRPYGASLWERWPEFGWYFSKDGDVEHWRGQREERDWPTVMRRSSPWPWAGAQAEGKERSEWHGPTKCMEAVVDFLNRHPGDSLSGNKLHVRMKAENDGRGYREETVRAAAEIAAEKGLIAVEDGPRSARVFSALPAENYEDELF